MMPSHPHIFTSSATRMRRAPLHLVRLAQPTLAMLPSASRRRLIIWPSGMSLSLVALPQKHATTLHRTSRRFSVRAITVLRKTSASTYDLSLFVSPTTRVWVSFLARTDTSLLDDKGGRHVCEPVHL